MRRDSGVPTIWTSDHRGEWPADGGPGRRKGISFFVALNRGDSRGTSIAFHETKYLLAGS